MKKIKKNKKKTLGSGRVAPVFVVGYTYGEAPPPGYLSAWFDQHYGGPLIIELLSGRDADQYEARHTQWRGCVNHSPSPASVQHWREHLSWEHDRVLEIIPGGFGGQARSDVVLHWTRLARGLTLLTEGTSFDLATGAYWNPSDWQDCPLEHFHCREHVDIGEEEQLDTGRTRYYSRGMGKFGLDELEISAPRGLPERAAKELLWMTAEQIVPQGVSPKVGAAFDVEETTTVEIVRHRTDQSTGRAIAYREIAVR